MKRIDLIKIEHNVQIGDICGHIEPNITEDSIFYSHPVSILLTLSLFFKHNP